MTQSRTESFDANELMKLGAADIADLVRRGELSAGDVLAASNAVYGETHSGSESLNAIVHRGADAGVNVSDASRSGSVGDQSSAQLAGVPIAIKDNIATLGMPTTCGSSILKGWTSPFEATVVKKLREQGAVLVGKANMDEFAMGSSTEHSAFGPTRNPIDRTRAPGGSSGGSAAAVAAGIATLALGSETGGSVRQPAAFCGIVGVKPTYGRVSRFGLVAFASSLDCIGTFGRTVDDAALATETVSGFDLRDATSVDTPVPTMRVGAASLKGMVVGIPKEYFPDSLDSSVRQKCQHAIELFKEMGAEVREVSLPHTELAIPVYYIIAPAECSANLARFDGVRYGMRMDGEGVQEMYAATRSQGFGKEVTRRILLGTYVLSAGYYDAYYGKAQEVRALIKNDFTNVFASGVDVLFTPTTPTPAFKLGAISDPYEMYMSDIFTVTANLAGVPAMSLPVGRVNGLPVGGQIIARHFAEPTMFKAAYALEQKLAGEGV